MEKNTVENKPTTAGEQEWNGSRIVKFLGLPSSKTEDCSFLADAINAALAAERERVLDCANQIDNLQEQLATERQYGSAVTGASISAEDEVIKLRTELAATKKNSTYQALGEKVQEIGRLNQQLAAAQAALKHCEPFADAWGERELHDEIKTALAGDTDALDAAIAEAQQPLLEALKRIKSLVCGDKVPEWQDDWRVTNSRMRIADQCDAALAKVPKEQESTVISNPTQEQLTERRENIQTAMRKL